MTSEAWALAERAATVAGIELRPLSSLDDADEIVRVMIATWGDHQTIPREMIRALAESGNVPIGAFAGGELVGYVLGWLGVDAAEGVHVHSHMLATEPDRRHRGIGYALKLAQRAQALDRGVTRARWTFDPLVARNGYLNLHKLGAVADRFGRDFYGQMTDDLNRGDRSDRFVVRWDLAREPAPRSVTPGRAVLDDGWRPTGAPPDEPGARIPVPDDLLALRERDRALASRCREAVAEAIESALGAGLAAVGFVRHEGGGSYVIGEDPER